jgi:hypothetical protein
MPIDYSKYPLNWKTDIRPAVLKRANNKCENCHVENYASGYRNKEGHFYKMDFIMEELDSVGLDMFDNELSHHIKKDGTAKPPIKIVLTIAHLNHDVKNNNMDNLKALCQRCHLNHDKEYHQKNRRESLNRKKGQIPLL